MKKITPVSRDYREIQKRMKDISKDLMHLSNDAWGNSKEFDAILKASIVFQDFFEKEEKENVK